MFGKKSVGRKKIFGFGVGKSTKTVSVCSVGIASLASFGRNYSDFSVSVPRLISILFGNMIFLGIVKISLWISMKV